MRITMNQQLVNAIRIIIILLCQSSLRPEKTDASIG